MKQNLRFRGCYCPKQIQPIYLLFMVFLLTGVGGKGAFGQSLQIAGKVTSASDGSPIAGATVWAPWSEQKAVTDRDGLYRIATVLTDSLIFKCIGYQTKVVVGVTETEVNVMMLPDTNMLEEVVLNAGYYSTTRKVSTGSIARVDGRVIAQQPVSNPIATLAGRVAGLEVSQLSGTPGGNFNVRIRGIGSIGNGNEPLYIINGIPYTSTPLSSDRTSSAVYGGRGSSPLNALNPQDIVSIEVLKDADATSIYGSRGANGVILITTKTGEGGPVRIGLTARGSVNNVEKRLDLLSASQYLGMRREAFRNDGMVPDRYSAPDLLLWDTLRSTDWQKELIGGNASASDVQLSIEGGTGKTRFLMSGGYRTETTVFPGDHSDRRISSSMALNHTSADGRLEIGWNVNLSGGGSNLPGRDLSSVVINLPPVAPPIHGDDGGLNWAEDTWINPLSYLLQEYRADSRNLITGLHADYRILRRLRIGTRVGYTDLAMKSHVTTPLRSQPILYRQFLQNYTNFGDNGFSNLLVEPQMNWDSESRIGKFQLLAGGTLLMQNSTFLNHFGNGYAQEGLMKSLSQAASIMVTNDLYNQYRYLAAYGRINYNYEDRYIINITGRRDGSSRFAPENRYRSFGAVGVAWNFAGERIFETIRQVVSRGKIRGSYGLTGNDQLGDYLYMNTYRSAGIYQGIRSLEPYQIYNPELEWESNRKLEIALETGFFRDRIALNLNWYRNRSANQLVNYPLPANVGFASMNLNIPAGIENSGLEVELGGRVLRSGRLQWRSDLNISVPRNRLLDFPNLELSSYASQYVVGKPMTIAMLYGFVGVDSETGEIMIRDRNGDGAISVADKTVPRFSGRYFHGGWNNSFSFGDFSVDLFLHFSKQDGQTFMSTYMVQPGGMSNQPVSVMDRWRKSGDEGDFPKFSSQPTAAYANWLLSDAGNGDVSFLRLKNVAVNYRLPPTWTKNLGLQQLVIFFQGQNLWTLTRYKGLDAEFPNDFFLPALRSFTGGVRLTI